MIAIPSPLPGEIAAGYEGRITRTHGVSSANSMLKGVRQESVNAPPPRPFQKVEVLSRACAMTLQAFVRSHTLLPLQRVVRDQGSLHAHGDPHFPGRLHGSMQLLRPSVYFCSSCVSEDLGFHGVSYWRRDHQVRGAWRCEKHPQELLRCTASSAIGEAPSNVRVRSVTTPAREPSRSLAAAGCLVGVSYALLDRESPIPIETALPAIRDRAESLGIRTLNSEAGTLLSDLVMETFDDEWLLEVCPQLGSKRPGRQAPGIDAWVSGRAPVLSGWSLPIVLATLWTSADDAMSSLVLTRAAKRLPPGGQRPRESNIGQ